MSLTHNTKKMFSKEDNLGRDIVVQHLPSVHEDLGSIPRTSLGGELVNVSKIKCASCPLN